MSGGFVIKKCKLCGKDRKFRVGAINDKDCICGECFDWSKNIREQTDE
jgi:hypothetical protein